MKSQKKVSLKLMDFVRHFEAVPQGCTGKGDKVPNIKRLL